MPLGSIAHIQLGKMLSPKSKTGTNAYPYLRNQNVQWDRLDLSDMAEMDFSADEREKFSLMPGDLLVCEGGEPGRAAIWRGEIAECFFQKAIHRIRPLAGVDAEFLLYQFWHMGNSGIFADANSQTTIAHLPLGRLQALPVSLLGMQEQRELVAVLRQQLFTTSAAMDAVRSQMESADSALRRSLLIEAFGTAPPVRLAADSGVPAGWSAQLMGALARLESGHTPSRRHPEWWGGGVPWLALPDIRKLHGKLAYETTENTNDAGLKNSSARLLPVGTVCVSRTASIGFVTVLGRPMATSQDFCNWVPD